MYYIFFIAWKCVHTDLQFSSESELIWNLLKTGRALRVWL